MSDSGFSKLRSFFWPIRRQELLKFLPMFILFFLVAFNYHLLRIAKDALIITAPKSGAEVIPFLKVWAMLPTAIVMTFLFTSLSNKFNRENIFYVMTSIFLVFFILFIFLLYPAKDAVQANHIADYLQTILPKGFKGLIAIIRYWSFSLFYVMAESWSTIMLSILIWGFANDVVSVKEAKRFYGFFGIGVNAAGILAGKFGEYLSVQMKRTTISTNYFTSHFGQTAWDQTLTLFVFAIIICCILIMLIYRWLHIHVFPNRYLMGIANEKSGKQKISLKDSLLYVFRSKYLIYIALIVLSYNLVINLTEVLWKSQMKELFPQASDYTAYMSRVTYYIGIIATFASYILSGNLIRKLGWKITAYITPLILISTGVGFFYFLFLKQYSHNASSTLMIMGMTPLALTVFFGSLQNILARSSKYTVFDYTKEMAFIPLNATSKLKGKSAIDGIGSRLGKSGSSFFMQLLLLIFTTPIACSPIIFLIILMIIPLWIISINSLSKQFEKITSTEPTPTSTTTEPANVN